MTKLQQILGAETMRQYRLYAASVPHAKVIPAKQRLEAVIRYALRDWMEVIGEGQIEDALGVPNPALDQACAALDRACTEAGFEPPMASDDPSRMN